MSKHAPKSWSATRGVVWNEKDEIIADCRCSPFDPDQDQKNSEFIALCPKMLDVLKKTEVDLDTLAHPAMRETLEMIRETIAKAEGSHLLKIKGLHDAEAECSCGQWSFTATGSRTREEIETEFNRHLMGKKTTKEDEAIAKAKRDFESVLGKEVLVHSIYGYLGEDSENRHFTNGDPLRVRILPTQDCDLERFTDYNWLDPVYNVEPLEERPEISEMRNFWIYGRSYNIKTGEETEGDIVEILS